MDGRQAAERTRRTRRCYLAAAREASVRGRRVAARRRLCHRRAMTRELTATILRVVERAPQWVRRDLDSKDPVVRVRAEESLAAMIADEIGRASCKERVGQYVYISVVAVSLKKKKQTKSNNKRMTTT